MLITSLNAFGVISLILSRMILSQTLTVAILLHRTSQGSGIGRVKFSSDNKNE